MSSLRNQILTLCIGVVSATALIILLTFLISTDKYVHQQIDRTVDNAVNTFNQLLETRESQLISSAQILTSDFGFKQSVATNDTATIASTLANHGERIQADLMLLTDLNGKFIASSKKLPGIDSSSPLSILRQQINSGEKTNFAKLGEDLYQMILLPIKAPIPVAYTTVGFKMDSDLAMNLSHLSGLEVTFVTGSSNDYRAIVSTLPNNIISTALNNLEPQQFSFFNKPLYSSKKISLSNSINGQFSVILSAPLAPAYLAFDKLRDNILLIAISILLVSILGSILFSRSMTNPLNKLVYTVGEFAKGNYRKVQVSTEAGTKELQTLFSAFSSMGEKIEEREKQITYQAQHDSLTDLQNRNSIISHLQQLMAKQQPFLLIALNIKGLRAINDTFGQAIGDRALINTAKRLHSFCRTPQDCARLGGDEFVVIIRNQQEITDNNIAEQLLKKLSKSICVDEIDLSLGFTFGLALFPDHASDPEQILRRVAIALDHSRAQKKPMMVYEEGADKVHMQRLTMVNDLKNALLQDDGQLFMVYQPKMNLGTREVDKLESLIRWMHPTDGFIPPDTFIELAEQSGLIIEVTNWVIKQVITQTAKWFHAGYNIQSAINISAQDLEREELLCQVEQHLKETGLPHHALCFELTERDMMQDAERAVSLMQGFKDKGFDLSVDDYGIGQSSLSKLKQMPVSEIKIDKSFVLTLDESETDQIIVHSTIELGHRFNLKVIAEGVENQASQDILAKMGCDYMQGYHLARPLPADKIENWLDEHELEQQPESIGNI